MGDEQNADKDRQAEQKTIRRTVCDKHGISCARLSFIRHHQYYKLSMLIIMALRHIAEKHILAESLVHLLTTLPARLATVTDAALALFLCI